MSLGFQLYSAEVNATKISTAGIEIIAGKTLEGLETAGPYVTVVVQALSIGMEIKSHTFPNEKERKHANMIAAKYSYLTAKKEFESCLIHNRNSSERGVSGCPTGCKDMASMLIMLGGKDEANRMTTIYNQFRK